MLLKARTLFEFGCFGHPIGCSSIAHQFEVRLISRIIPEESGVLYFQRFRELLRIARPPELSNQAFLAFYG
jgi:hypothetical protein